jgi:pilus assembly protein Flp/PilA
MLIIKAKYWLEKLTKNEEGQGMVEYGLIIAAIAVVVGVAVWALGPKIATLFNNLSFTSS